VLVAQDTWEVTLHRRSEEWQPVVFTEPDAMVELRSIQLSIPVKQIYEGVL